MPRFRRSVVPGGTFFLTVVTDRRRPLFADPRARRMLSSVIRRCLLCEPFPVNAIVWLEDHLHAIWTLTPGDTAYSQRWGWIKPEFRRHWSAGGGREGQASQAKKRQPAGRLAAAILGTHDRRRRRFHAPFRLRAF